MSDIHKQVEKELQKGIPVLFVSVPKCHIAQNHNKNDLRCCNSKYKKHLYSSIDSVVAE